MFKNTKNILITGGAGYIGQNLTSFFIKERFKKISIIDNLSTSKKVNKKIKKYINFYNIDLTNKKKMDSFFKKKNFDLIIHLAAFSGVHEFNKNLLKSFNNNIVATRNLVNFGFKKENTKLIFASSAAVYGKVSSNKISENHNLNPANYYGLSKLACENIINNTFKSKKNHYAILRYFNVVGSIIDYKIIKKINSLMDVIKKNINKKTYKININGKNFNTKDGTPERDFIHVNDLCKIHEKTFKFLLKKRHILINCGSGVRYSVLAVIREFEKKLKKKFKLTYKIKNTDETQTICADINSLKKLLKIDIEKKNINDLLKEYF